jgi:hypothetical protein
MVLRDRIPKQSYLLLIPYDLILVGIKNTTIQMLFFFPQKILVPGLAGPLSSAGLATRRLLPRVAFGIIEKIRFSQRNKNTDVWREGLIPVSSYLVQGN